jgi:hypothetical protein
MDDGELAALERELEEAVARVASLQGDLAGLGRAEDRATELAGRIRKEAERRRETWQPKPRDVEGTSLPAADNRAVSMRQ